MKSLLIAIVLLGFCSLPASAQEFATVSASPNPNVLGLYDEDLTSTRSASLSATPTATPSARATTYIDPSNAPVSGTFETSLFILMAGTAFIFLGIQITKNS